MKKSRNFIISSLVALTGATLASSVTGTVAWFQYATSASIAYTGTTASCSKLLQLKVNDGDWSTDVILGKTNPAKFSPVTTGEKLKTAALGDLHLGPTYRKPDINDWGTATAGTEYQQFTLSIRLNDVSDGNDTLENAKICLSDLTIANAGSGDIEKAIRVHLAVTGGNNYLFSLNGGSTAVCGKLDLNNDGKLDVSGYDFEEQTQINYGGTSGVQTSYAADDDSVIGQELGQTNDSALQIIVTVWVEGWALLGTGQTGNAQTSNTAVWSNATYEANDFHVGMTFDVVE